MLIEISKLTNGPNYFRGVASKSMFDDISEDPFIHFDSDINYDLIVIRIKGTLFVSGTLDFKVRFLCSRCGKETVMAFIEPNFKREIELLPNTEFIDLILDIREASILAVPNYPICRPDCKGRCPYCGKDLNDGPCRCGDRDWRWDVLNSFSKEE